MCTEAIPAMAHSGGEAQQSLERRAGLLESDEAAEREESPRFIF
jgi:hypothetical protein